MNDNITKKHEKLFLKLRVNELEDKVKQLETFIEQNLGLSKPAAINDCSVPTSYCNSCACGKKEAILAKEKK